MKLLKKKYLIAIATGSSKIVLLHSTKKVFTNLFDLIVSINDVKKGKPNPDQLILASKKLKIKKENCLMVGDSLYDLEAAKNAGMDFIGVTTGFTSRKEMKKHGAKIVVKSIWELGKII